MSRAGADSSPPPRRPHIVLLYHYFHPDDVISARNFSDLAEALVQRGWDVEALPCNRGCRDDRQRYPLREEWKGVRIRRVWRPRWKQSSSLGRLANALYMIGAWSLLAFRRGRQLPDVLLMGTDPVLSVLVAGVFKTLRPQVKIAHWAHDLYPEAPLADGMLKPNRLLVRWMTRLLRWAYHSCDWIADLGPCMREQLEKYDHACRKVTLVPWGISEPAQVEPAEPRLRDKLFGQARLALLYSGNFGRAHAHDSILKLARLLRGAGVAFTFAVRGNRVDELRAAITPDDTNIRLAPFAEEAELAQHLAAADIHLASLRPQWTGIVVPSKFFGSLAAGRPVLFAGDAHASIARWIREYQVGWHLEAGQEESLADILLKLSKEPAALRQMQQHCFEVYHQHFSKSLMLDAFNRELLGLIQARR